MAGYKFKPKKKGEKGEKQANSTNKTNNRQRAVSSGYEPSKPRDRPQTAPSKRIRPSRAKARPAPMTPSFGIGGMTLRDEIKVVEDEAPQSLPEVKAELNAIWSMNEEQAPPQSSQASNDQFATLLQPAFPSNDAWFASPQSMTLEQPTFAHQEAQWPVPVCFGGDLSMPLDATPALSTKSFSPSSYESLANFSPQIVPQHQLFPTAAELDMISPFMPPSPSYTFPQRPLLSQYQKHGDLRIETSTTQAEEPSWWPFRFMRVKRDAEGVELQELLRQLQEESAAYASNETFLV